MYHKARNILFYSFRISLFLQLFLQENNVVLCGIELFFQSYDSFILLFDFLGEISNPLLLRVNRIVLSLDMKDFRIKNLI